MRTAKIIKRHISDAKFGMLVLGSANLPYTKACFEVFKRRNALGLFHWATIYHDYSPNPDDCYKHRVEAWAAFVLAEAPHLRIWNGESGATFEGIPCYDAPVVVTERSLVME